MSAGKYETDEAWLSDRNPYGNEAVCKTCGATVAVKHVDVFHAGTCTRCGNPYDEPCNHHVEERGKCQLKRGSLSDVEILDLAARALGWIDYPYDSIEAGTFWHMDKLKAPFGPRIEKSSWNPLDKDGDCACLEADLGINFQWKPDRCVLSFCKGWVAAELYSEYDNDRRKARRYASTKVAAMVGKEMVESALKAGEKR